MKARTNYQKYGLLKRMNKVIRLNLWTDESDGEKQEFFHKYGWNYRKDFAIISDSYWEVLKYKIRRIFRGKRL